MGKDEVFLTFGYRRLAMTARNRAAIRDRSLRDLIIRVCAASLQCACGCVSRAINLMVMLALLMLSRHECYLTVQKAATRFQPMTGISAFISARISVSASGRTIAWF